MNTLSTLILTRALLTKPGSWTKEKFASDKGGKVCDARSPAAVSWCLRGAIDRVTRDRQDMVNAVAAMRPFVDDVDDCRSFLDWNDHPDRTQSEVLAVLDKAISAEVENHCDYHPLPFDSLFLAVFNGHVNDASKRSMEVCRRHFAPDDTDMQRLEEAYPDEIMEVFDTDPTSASHMFALCVFVLANGLAEEIEL